MHAWVTGQDTPKLDSQVVLTLTLPPHPHDLYF